MGDPKHRSRSHLPQVLDEEGDGSLHHPKHKSHRHRHFEEEEDRKRKHRRDETEEARKVRKRLKKEKRSSERDDEKLKVLEDEDDGQVWVEKGVDAAVVSGSLGAERHWYKCS